MFPIPYKGCGNDISASAIKMYPSLTAQSDIIISLMCGSVVTSCYICQCVCLHAHSLNRQGFVSDVLNNVSTGSCNGCLGWGCFWKLYSHLNGMVHMNVLTPLYDVANYIVLAIRIMSAGDCFKVMGTCGLN